MGTNSARFLAPIALAAVAVGTYLIVQNGLHHHHSSTAQSTQVQTGTTAGRRLHHPTPRFYIVKSGDTLSEISVKTHVSILRISALNPGISPNSLQTGQRLRLRR